MVFIENYESLVIEYEMHFFEKRCVDFFRFLLGSLALETLKNGEMRFIAVKTPDKTL
jgi:hypothetical protein